MAASQAGQDDSDHCWTEGTAGFGLEDQVQRIALQRPADASEFRRLDHQVGIVGHAMGGITHPVQANHAGEGDQDGDGGKDRDRRQDLVCELHLKASRGGS